MDSKSPEIFDDEDINAHKTLAALAYFLFFLPLVCCPDSRYARFHANQALILLLVAVAGGFVLGFIPLIGSLLRTLFSIAILLLLMLGILHGVQGKAVRLPIIGSVDLLA